MGRGKIEIKRIENSANRQVTYSKRRGGIIKKAKEITVLCDAEVSLIIFSSTGKMSEYCSSSTNLVKLLDKYQTTSGKMLWDARHEYLKNEKERIRKENESMQLELRHLQGEELNSLTTQDLLAIEDLLQNGSRKVRTKQGKARARPQLMGKKLRLFLLPRPKKKKLKLIFVMMARTPLMLGDDGYDVDLLEP